MLTLQGRVVIVGVGTPQQVLVVDGKPVVTNDIKLLGKKLVVAVPPGTDYSELTAAGIEVKVGDHA